VRVIVHPEYNKPERRANDVALVFVQNPGFVINDFVRPICLWKFSYNISIIENQTGMVKRMLPCLDFGLNYYILRWSDGVKPKTIIGLISFKRRSSRLHLTVNVT
jgi:hypothetical protein